MSERPAYFDKYKTMAFERYDDGVLVIRLHSDNGPVRYGAAHHQDWTPAFTDVAADRDNRVVIITGTGEVFIDGHEPWEGEPLVRPRDYDLAGRRQKLLFDRLLDIDVPVIGVVNGPARLHAELVLMSEITLAAEHAVFADNVHFPHGEPSNDGAHILWHELLGMNRSKYFLMTGHDITAHQAHELGFVNEVWPSADLMPRALEIAHQLATYTELGLRYQRRASADRWKQLFHDHYGVGFGMATECLYYLDLDGVNPMTPGGEYSATQQQVEAKQLRA